MLTREEKHESEKLILAARKNELKQPEPKHYEQAKEMEKQWRKFEDEKNHDCERMIANGCKEAAADVDKFITREAMSVHIMNTDGCFKKDEKRYCSECGKPFIIRYAMTDFCLICYVKYRVYLWTFKWSQIRDRIDKIRDVEECPFCLVKRIIGELRKGLAKC